MSEPRWHSGKRIEAGREMMIGGICESPLTIRALMHWRDQIADGVVPLRDIIDLEATFAKLRGNPLFDHNNLDPIDDEIPDGDLEDDAEGEEEDELYVPRPSHYIQALMKEMKKR